MSDRGWGIAAALAWLIAVASWSLVFRRVRRERRQTVAAARGSDPRHT